MNTKYINNSVEKKRTRKYKSVLRIHDILVRIRVRGSMPLTNGSRSGSCYFRHWPSRRQQKLILKISFSSYYFLKVDLHHFQRQKVQKKSQNSRMIKGSGSVPLNNGYGAGSRSKNIRIERSRIRITDINNIQAFLKDNFLQNFPFLPSFIRIRNTKDILNSAWKHLRKIISPEHEGIPLWLRFILRVRHFLL